MNHEEIFHLSYWRATQRTIDGVAFLNAFYKNFLASSPRVAREFKTTDFDSLARMLAISIVHVARYYQTHQPDALLKVLAVRHSRRGLDIKPDLYEYWMQSLIATVKVYDPAFDDVTAEAWRHVITPGVEYMKSKYAEPRSGPSGQLAAGRLAGGRRPTDQ